MEKKLLLFGIVGGISYLGHFVMMVMNTDNYAPEPDEMYVYLEELDARGCWSYETTILMLFIYHFIEWIRATLLLTAMLIGVNLVTLYYILGVNAIFGIVAIIMAHANAFGNTECAGYYPTEANDFLIEVIVFWLTFWWTEFPMVLFFKFMKKSTLDEALKEEEEEEGEGDK